MLRRVLRDVDVDLGERLDRKGVDVSRGLAARAGDFERTLAGRAENAFGDVTATGIAGAEHEDERFVGLHRC